MNWLYDQLPWWVWIVAPSLGIGGGLLAVIIFIPPALPFLIGLWKRMPWWVHALLVAITAGVALYFKGRNDSSRARDEQERTRSAEAVMRRDKVRADVAKMKPSEVDKYLEKNGDFYD